MDDGRIEVSDRITLRPYREDDADRVLDIHSRMDVIRWLDDPPHVPMQTHDEALAWIARWAQPMPDEPRTRGLAIEVDDGRGSTTVAGTVMIVAVPNSDGELQIGWHLHPDSTGYGYVTEAARALLTETFASGVPHVYALMFVDNGPSAAVCERLGMTDLGIIQKWYEGDSRCFVVTREQWGASAD